MFIKALIESDHLERFFCAFLDLILLKTEVFRSKADIREDVHLKQLVFRILEYQSDTEDCVRFDRENKPGVANLMTIYSAVTGKTFDQIETEFAGCGYGKFKPAVGEAVVETLRPIREEATRLMKDKGYLESVYKAGAEKAGYVAEKTLRKVYKKVGFVAR